MNEDDHIIALVDYDNVRLEQAERSATDVLRNMDELIDRLVVHIERYAPAREVRVRLYGGWTNFQGVHTPQAMWVLSAASALRGLRRRVRVLPDVVTALAALPGYQLRGMYRERKGQPAVQKMVDTVLCSDAVFLTASNRVVIASDDDDVMIGGLAAAAQKKRQTHLLRRRRVGVGLNDSICGNAGLSLFMME